MDKRAKNSYGERIYHTLYGGSKEPVRECEDQYDEDLDWFERGDEDFPDERSTSRIDDFRLNVLDRIREIAKRNDRTAIIVAGLASVSVLALLIAWLPDD